MRDTMFQMDNNNATKDMACQPPKMEECNHYHPMRTTKIKLCIGTKRKKAVGGGDVGAGAQERAVDEGLVRKVHEGRAPRDGLLRWYLPHAEATVLLDHHRRFAGCDLGSDVLSAAELDFFNFFLQVLNQYSDNTRGNGVRAAPQTFK